MDSDIVKTVQMIDQRILKLHHMREMLIEEFGLRTPPITGVAIQQPTTNGNLNGIATGSGTGFGSHNRRDQLVTFLTQHGPATRSKINEESGIPKGTIANLLNKGWFVRRDGKWHVNASSAQETTQ